MGDPEENKQGEKKEKETCERDPKKTKRRRHRGEIFINPLTKEEYERLDWSDGPFNFPGMVRIQTIGDGSCFFHAIAKSYYTHYLTWLVEGNTRNCKLFVRELREDLANELEAPADPNVKNGPIKYDLLSRGQLKAFGEAIPRYSLKNMQKELRSNAPVDYVYNELISNAINKDIYILDLYKKDVYCVGQEDGLLYKNRDSIVILYLPGHYELVGIERPSGLQTLFNHEDPFILAIRNRLAQL